MSIAASSNPEMSRQPRTSRGALLAEPAHGSERPPTAPAHTASPYGTGAAYDRYMGRWSRYLARQFLAFAEIGPAEQVLDVGCGTGALTAALATATDATQIVGIDPQPGLLHAARQRLGECWETRPRIAFDCAGAGDIPHPDGRFDASLSLLSFHHFRSDVRALPEMRRATRPGGIVAACEWDSGPGMELFEIPRATLAAVYPPATDAITFSRYAGPGELAHLWRAAGLHEVEERAITLPLTFADFQDFWRPFIEGPASVARLVKQLPAPLQGEFRRELKRRLLRSQSDGSFILQAHARAVRGVC